MTRDLSTKLTESSQNQANGIPSIKLKVIGTTCMQYVSLLPVEVVFVIPVVKVPDD